MGEEVPVMTRLKSIARLALTIAAIGTASLVPVSCFATDSFRSLGSQSSGERLERMKQSSRYDDGEFRNTHPVEVMKDQDYWGMTKKWYANRNHAFPNEALALEKRTMDDFGPLQEPELKVTWLGHSTILLEIDGARFLTDPVWSDRASPSQWVGPLRFHPPPLRLEDVPTIHGILISHDHYDHLDMHTIVTLAERKIPFYVPLGVGAHLEGWGVPTELIHEFDWWEEVTVPDTRITLVSTPAQHFSGRGLFDRNGTLWTSWTLIGQTHRVFFSGDTGLTNEFVTIGEKFGPFDLTMLEIGAYDPSWGSIHLGPTQAITAHQMLKGNALLPIHWGTFDLGLHGWKDPGEEIVERAKKAGVNLLTPILGVRTDLMTQPKTQPWW